jgi:hypothetical protein
MKSFARFIVVVILAAAFGAADPLARATEPAPRYFSALP